MQAPRLIIIAILLTILLNVLMVVATIVVKALRSYERRRVESLRERLEPPLYDYLVAGDVAPILRQVEGRDLNVLTNMIIEFLGALRGSEARRMAELAGELGLVERDLDRLGSRGRWRRAKAAENLGYYGGPDAAAPVGGLLQENDETVRAVAARALSRIGTREAAEALTHFLGSDSELTRLRIAENLERIGPLAVGQLIELVESEEEDKRRAQVLAARILGNLRVADARPALRDAIQRHWNTDLRAQATQALGKIGDPDDVPAILEAATDSSWPVRVQAANALGMIGEVSTVPTLEDLATDEEWWVRLNASRALVNIGPAGEKALIRILESPDRFARDRAVATLESHGIVRRLAEQLAEGNEESDRAAGVIQSLIHAGATRHLERLSQSLPRAKERRALHKFLVETKAELETEPDDA